MVPSNGHWSAGLPSDDRRRLIDPCGEDEALGPPDDCPALGDEEDAEAPPDPSSRDVDPPRSDDDGTCNRLAGRSTIPDTEDLCSEPGVRVVEEPLDPPLRDDGDGRPDPDPLCVCEPVPDRLP